jgi:hypothetical protein
MTEADWQASEDPACMLAYLRCTGRQPSDRKLRLFACACVRRVWHLLEGRARRAVAAMEEVADDRARAHDLAVAIEGGDSQTYYYFRRNQDHALTMAERARWNAGDSVSVLADDIGDGWPRTADPLNSVRRALAADGGTDPDSALSAAVPMGWAAALLREVAGNPFRPIYLPCNVGCKVMTSGRGDKPHRCHTHHKDVEYVGSDKRTRYAVCPDSLEYFRATRCTPTVLSLAQAAYDERGRACAACMRKLNMAARIAATPVPWLNDERGRIEAAAESMRRCPQCGGSGAVDDGTLDNHRLLVLSDALEEAGCDCVPLLMHLRGLEPDWHFGAKAWIASRPLPGPHVRGCWALDLVLGKP